MRVTLASETLHFTAENARQRDELVAVCMWVVWGVGWAIWSVGFRRFRV